MPVMLLKSAYPATAAGKEDQDGWRVTRRQTQNRQAQQLAAREMQASLLRKGREEDWVGEDYEYTELNQALEAEYGPPESRPGFVSQERLVQHGWKEPVISNAAMIPLGQAAVAFATKAEAQ